LYQLQWWSQADGVRAEGQPTQSPVCSPGTSHPGTSPHPEKLSPPGSLQHLNNNYHNNYVLTNHINKLTNQRQRR